MSLLEVKDLCRTFRQGDTDIHAVGHVSFSMEAGEMLAIVGQSGSGKTTLLNLLGGIDKPSAGQVLLDGRDIHTLSDAEAAKLRRQKIGYIYQDFKLLPILTAKENIMLPAILDGKKAPARVVSALADRLGIGNRLNHLPSQMSGGQRQRLTIARALVRRPELLILDDSASALDFATDAALRKALSKLPWKPTVVLISQRVSSIRHADKIVVLDDGHMAGLGTHTQLQQTCPVYQEICRSQEKGEASAS